jgi:Tfp pilus assembly protein PilN
MKTKYAIGLAVNGNEIRAAFLSLVRGKACIEALESTKLDAPLENIQQPESKHESLNDLEKAFDIPEPKLHDEEQTVASEKSPKDNNIGLIYSLVDRFQHLKTSVAVNTPVLTVKYDFLDGAAVAQDKNLKKKIKERINIWGKDDDDGARRSNYLEVSDGKILQIDYEHHPPIIDLVEEVNQFRAGNMSLVLMDSNELALVDLVREIYKFKKDEITAIVYVEQDFSRVIFLKGKNIYHITPIIHKGSMSKDVLEVIYSRIIFAQDHYFIPEINKILVAGHSSKLKAKYYFRQKFPYAITGYLNSRKIQSHLRFKDRGLLFSRYAIAIALAWKALQKNVVKSKSNLLPEYLLERHKMPKLALHGYLLLALLGLTAFGFTMALVSKNLDLRQVKRKIATMKAQIENNKSLTERIQSFDNQIVDLEKKLSLVDDYSKGFDETIEFLNLLNQAVASSGGMWLTDFRKQGNVVTITGMARERERIPILANALGGANLKKVTRSDLHDTRVFEFQLEKTIDTTEKSKGVSIQSLLAGNGSNGNGAHAPALYGVQVGVFGTQAAADREAQKYLLKGYAVKVSPLNAKQFAVIVGSYENEQDANQIAGKLPTTSGAPNKVVRLR